MSGWYDTVVVKGAKHRVRVGTPAATNSREAFLEIADLTSAQQCIDYGTQWLAAHSAIVDQVDLGIQPTAPELTPWDGIGVGDALQYDDRAGDQERGRIHGVGFTGLRRNGEPNWTVTLGSASQERGIVARRQLSGLTQGTMSGTFKAGAVSIALSFADVPAELMGGGDVFKSPSADLIEGGISGTVNLRTRLPFDNKGEVLSLSGEVSYGDMIKKYRPSITGLYSNRWDTSIGEVGVLASYVNSRLASQSNAIQVSNFGCRTNLGSATADCVFLTHHGTFNSGSKARV